MRRELGVWLGIFITFNATIGAGIFKTPAHIAEQAGSIRVTWWSGSRGGDWISLCGALSLAELGAAMPRTGGLYEYLRRPLAPGRVRARLGDPGAAHPGLGR